MDDASLASRDLIEVSRRPLEAGSLAERVADPGAGAVVVFLGTVRDHSSGRDGVTHLEYEAYEGVVEEKIAELVGEARRSWPLCRVAVVHRVGDLGVGDASVGVAVSSEHRPEAFEAARYLIDQLKARAPIWKKEHWAGGAEWVREG
jgi:molybdopterin synthase catalytic subunit